jgi:uncharacterized membrane protein
MPGLRTTTLLAATATSGLAAGTFALYAHTIMPGLHATDDRTFVTAFQSLDRSIINPWFLGGTFLGSIVFVTAAAITNRSTPGAPWITTAVALSATAIAITAFVHVPLNNAIKAHALVSNPAALATIRGAFHEVRWARWNLVRTASSIVSFGCLLWSLAISGRTS